MGEKYISKINRCKYCGSTNLNFIKTENNIHFGKLECGHCKTFICWVKNPDSPRANSLRINKKTVKEVMIFHGFENDEFCFNCLRGRENLGVCETLTIDHIKELDKGGEDSIQNMQVLCSACHKLKNWCRLYMNWHLINEDRENDTNTRKT